jgi:hypothetical protein
MSAFFDDVWAEDFYKSNFDITNLVIPSEDANELDKGEDHKAKYSSFKRRLAELLKK